MAILYQFLQNYFKGVEDLLNLFKIMPPDHRAKISTVNPEEVVEILEDSKIFVTAMYPTMVWNFGRHLFFQFTIPYSRLSFNWLYFISDGGSNRNIFDLIPIFTKQTKKLQTIVCFVQMRDKSNFSRFHRALQTIFCVSTLKVQKTNEMNLNIFFLFK